VGPAPIQQQGTGSWFCVQHQWRQVCWGKGQLQQLQQFMQWGIILWVIDWANLMVVMWFAVAEHGHVMV